MVYKAIYREAPLDDNPPLPYIVGIIIDGSALAQEIENVANALEGKGYEVKAVTPITRASIGEAPVIGGTGGHGFTQGVIILAKK